MTTSQNDCPIIDITYYPIVTVASDVFGGLDTGNEKVIWFCGVHRNDPTSSFQVAIKILAAERTNQEEEAMISAIYAPMRRRSHPTT